MNTKKIILPLYLLILTTSFYASEANIYYKLKTSNQPLMKRYIRQASPKTLNPTNALTFIQRKETGESISTGLGMKIKSYSISTQKLPEATKLPVEGKIIKRTSKHFNLKHL